MAKLAKRLKTATANFDKNSFYSLMQAISLVKGGATAKFDESIDIAINLGVDPRKADQMIRGALVLPNGTGKTLKVAVFAQGPLVKEAQDAGADMVGFEDLAADIKKGIINFDLLIATPDTMRLVGTLGQILGPRGLMPNPKVGTVTANVAQAIKDAKAGQVQYRTDKYGIIHTTIGRASFADDKLIENLQALVSVVLKAKPASAKGTYLKKLSLSSTMGGMGVKVNPSSINEAKH